MGHMMKNTCKIFIGKPEGRKHLGEQGVEGGYH
jgi:hypothetical protein